MKKLGVVITDGVGFRNFILSDFVTESKKKFDEVVILSCLPREAYEDLQLNCDIIELDVFEETFYTWFFRKAKELAHLQLHKKGNFGIQDNLRANFSHARNPRGYATRFLFHWTKCFHFEPFIQQYNKWQQSSFKKDVITQKYIELLEEEQFSSLFFTHQRPPFIAPLIYAAEQSKILTTTFIFSWDNLASKNRMAGNFNNYLVWSNLMKKELLHFYPNIKSQNVEVVGTPQFEPYVLDRYYISKADFLEKFGLEPNRKIIFFTCNDSSSKNDPIYLEKLAEFIKGNKIEKDVAVVVRTSPAEDSVRFEKLKDKYPFLIWNIPDWKLVRSNHQESWTQRIPSLNDVINLRALLNYCDLSINVLSTITLDAFLFDKPVVNPVFGNSQNDLFDDQKFLNYAHLDVVVKSNSTNLALNEEDFLNMINKCLNQPNEKIDFQHDLINIEIGKPLKGTSERIAQVLKNWS